MLFRFSLYGFLKNQRYFEPFFMLALIAQDLSFFIIGLLYATRSLTINLLEIPSGALADGYGRRHTMIGSMLAYILSFAVFGLARSLPLLFLAMVLYGIGDSFRTGTHKSMIFAWLRLQGRESERTKIYGITRSWSQFGSAVSALLAGGFVLLTDDYQAVFLIATIPYIANMINLIGYPAELDGLVYRQSLWQSLERVGGQLKKTLHQAWTTRPLRRLVAESMAWEGVFNAIKDYLQPALMLLVLAILADPTVPLAEPSGSMSDGGIALTSANQSPSDRSPPVVITVALTYTLLFFASGLVSRQAHRLVSRAGSPQRAASWLWRFNCGLFILLAFTDLLNLPTLVVLTFVMLFIVQNVWRPILIGRFDEQCQANQGATILSIESQSQRLATFVVAPIAGLCVDFVLRQQLPGHLWPLAAIGAAAAGIILATSEKHPTC